jgi:hypothetical protein
MDRLRRYANIPIYNMPGASGVARRIISEAGTVCVRERGSLEEISEITDELGVDSTTGVKRVYVDGVWFWSTRVYVYARRQQFRLSKFFRDPSTRESNMSALFPSISAWFSNAHSVIVSLDDNI